MATIPYALSIQHFINSVGAKAGFASLIAVALLVLIFFTQSRETANLRRRADEAEQQLYQLQLYVDHLSRTRNQPAAVPAPAAAQATGAPVAAPPAAALAAAAASRTVPGEQVAAGGGGVATIPAAPAGVAAPALSAATRLIPLAEPDEISIRALRPSTNGTNGDSDVNGATVFTPPPSPPPSTAAGGSNGVARPPAPVPMPTMGTPPPQPAPPPRVALPRQQRAPVTPPPAARRAGRESSGRRVSPVAFILAGVLAAAVVAVVLIFVTGSGNGGSASASSSSGASASASSTSAAKTAKSGKRHHAATATGTVTPSGVTVAVLNGTSTNHLAADVLGKLTTAGYKGGTTQNAAETGMSSTIVGYTAPSYRADALAVAKSLNLGPASVQGVSQGDRAKVCGTTTACTTQVVVTVGADLAPAG
jgi:hypothetical protein